MDDRNRLAGGLAAVMLSLGAVCLGGCAEDAPGSRTAREGDATAAQRDGALPAVCTDCGACEEAVAVGEPIHLRSGIEYGSVPPAGGPHAPCWADYGVYPEPLDAAKWVHNLEHGAVVVLYHCPDGCAAQVASIEELVAGAPRTIATPYPAMAPGFAIVAWGHRLVSECLDLAAFEAFYDAYVDTAPESVASGAPSGC